MKKAKTPTLIKNKKVIKSRIDEFDLVVVTVGTGVVVGITGDCGGVSA